MNSFQRHILLTVLFAALFTVSCPAQSTETNTSSYMVFGGGVAGVVDHDKTIFGMVEFQPALRVGPFGTWIALHASDQDYYMGAGLLYNWYVTDHLFITPSLGAGVYAEHNGTDLGYPIEFRSGIECGYDFEEAGRVSIGIWHLSNAGLGADNPGTELVALRYAMPVSWF
jgi:hypothetical protein